MHIPVLLNQAVDALVVNTSGVYLDGTFGRGGHSRAILAKLSSEGRLYAFDKDPEAVAAGQMLQKCDRRFRVFHRDFVESAQVLVQDGVAKLHGALFDLGVSSNQLENAVRGFSFQQDGPLDMRMDNSQGQTLAQWLSEADEQDIIRVLRTYGQERYAGAIARSIIRNRPVASTRQLASIIAASYPASTRWKRHPATKSFQAFRIRINAELDSLALALNRIVDMLVTGGRLVVISFHSLEDRIVKRYIADKTGLRPPASVPTMRWLVKPMLLPLGKYTPDPEEIARNPRSRSAVLRVAERLPTMVEVTP